MCGIAGWVDFARDLRAEKDRVRVMRDAMACRGPDGQGLWASPQAVLGHSRTAVIDIAGGGQPMIVEGADGPLAAVAFNGELDNYQELRRELSASGHRFVTGSDTEVLARAYLHWGDDCVDHFRGMFAFALWDVRRETMVLARDPLGIKPLFYVRTSTGLLLGSEPKALLAHPSIEPVVDADGLRQVFAQLWTPGREVFRDIREVAPGHLLKVDRSGVSVRRYWALQARPHSDDLDTTVATIREMLDDIVAHQLIVDAPLGILLSGGLDSSAITAMAARRRREERREPVRTFSVGFADQAENFAADLVRDSPDEPFAEETAHHVGSAHSCIRIKPAELMDPEVRMAALRALDVPTMHSDMDASLFLLFRGVREHSVVALMGEGADEIFGGYMWMHHPDLVRADTFPWVAMERLWGGEGKPPLGCGLVDAGLLRDLDIRGYTVDRYRDALAEVPHLPDESDRERRMREIVHLHLTSWLPILLNQDDKLAMASGLELRLPFCDHRLVEYAFNIPWEMKSFDGREKSLLRAAVGDLLPSSVLSRKKSPFPVVKDPEYVRTLLAELARFQSDSRAPAAELADRAAIQNVLENPGSLFGGPGSWAARTSVEMVLQLNSWLADYGVRLNL